VQQLLDDGRVDLRDPLVYGRCVCLLGRFHAKAGYATPPIRQCMDAWLRWRQRRPWLRACARGRTRS
jgi:hypothetical protein